MEQNNKERLYTLCVAFFCVVVILSNLITAKLFKAPFLADTVLPTGMVTYPLTFIVSDLITEIYGTKRARFMIYLGFTLSFLTYGIIQIALALPPHDVSHQKAFEHVFGLSDIAILSSMVAYVIAQVIDVQLFEICKRFTRERHLWFRNNASTLVSQLIDTIVVNFILLYWGLQLEVPFILHIIGISYLYKVLCTICSTPLFYLGVAAARRYLGEVKLQPVKSV